jgi:hypothetical protein
MAAVLTFAARLQTIVALFSFKPERINNKVLLAMDYGLDGRGI